MALGSIIICSRSEALSIVTDEYKRRLNNVLRWRRSLSLTPSRFQVECGFLRAENTGECFQKTPPPKSHCVLVCSLGSGNIVPL